MAFVSRGSIQLHHTNRYTGNLRLKRQAAECEGTCRVTESPVFTGLAADVEP